MRASLMKPIQIDQAVDPLHQIASRAVINAESGLRFEKDWRKVAIDARHDLKALGSTLSAGRLKEAVRSLLTVTIFVAEDDDREDWTGALLALSSLVRWVEEERRRLDV